MTASAEHGADLADIDARIFGAQADADFAVRQFLEEGGDDDAFDGADVIDETFVVLGLHAEGRRRRQGKAKLATRSSLVKRSTFSSARSSSSRRRG